MGKSQNPSQTALATASMRIAHLLLDSPPWILEDRVAEKLLSASVTEKIKAAPIAYQTAEMRALRAHVVFRSRFSEDRLAMAVQDRQVSQYIILGAGFDSFALRQPAWAHSLQIFEVDQKVSQDLKQARIAEAGIKLPENVHFVTIDFEKESLSDGLRRCAVSWNQPTFFSWLGVTMYLNEAAIDAVLQSVVSFPAGSEIVFTFARQVENVPSPFDERSARVGEPWLTYFDPGILETKLHALGFSSVNFLSSEEANALYFSQSRGDLAVPRHPNIVAAIR
jgi:methyltransferase (TIGR00027 family)